MKRSDIEVGKVYGSRPYTPPEHREVLDISPNGEMVKFCITFDSRTKRNRQGQTRSMTTKAFARWAGETPPGPRTVPNGDEVTASTCAKKVAESGEPGIASKVSPVPNACQEVELDPSLTANAKNPHPYHYPEWLVKELRGHLTGREPEMGVLFRALQEGKGYKDDLSLKLPRNAGSVRTSIEDILGFHVKLLRNRADELEALKHVLARFGEIEDSLADVVQKTMKFRPSVSVGVAWDGGPGSRATKTKTVEVDGYYSGDDEIRKVLQIDSENVYYQIVKSSKESDEGTNRHCSHASFGRWYDKRLKFKLDLAEQVEEVLETHLFRRDVQVGSYYLNVEKTVVARVVDLNRFNVTFIIEQVAPGCTQHRMGQALSWDWHSFLMWAYKQVEKGFEFGAPKIQIRKTRSAPGVSQARKNLQKETLYEPGKHFVNHGHNMVVEIKDVDTRAAVPSITYMVKKSVNPEARVGHVQSMTVSAFHEWNDGEVADLAACKLTAP